MGSLPVCKYSVRLKQKVQKRTGLYRVASVIWPQSRASSNHQLCCYTQTFGSPGSSGKGTREEEQSAEWEVEGVPRKRKTPTAESLGGRRAGLAAST